MGKCVRYLMFQLASATTPPCFTRRFSLGEGIFRRRRDRSAAPPARRRPRWERERLALERLEDRTLPAVTVGLNFTASTFLTDTGAFPPDTDGAVGPAHFVELLNGRYSAYDKASGARVPTSSLAQFWRTAGVPPAPASGPFDPRVLYDHPSGRWFASSADTAEGGASDFLVAVSTSSNPTAGWKGFALDADATNVNWADFDTFGLDADGVY